MKLFCGCNSTKRERDSYMDYPENFKERRATAGFKGSKDVPICKVCALFPWVDADYENMMFDLRSMNS